MAEAPGHRLGQIIGDALESSLQPVLQDFADRHGLYLDGIGPRPARPGRKVSWRDDLGNNHDLDFVLERGGTYDKMGIPAAFIESAWRRYTKHSRAKAQEIQGAVLPLVSRWAEVRPFAGAIIAGNWTGGALQQLTSSGFTVLHIGYDEIVQAFARYGIDVDAQEDTPDTYLQAQVDAYDALNEEERLALGATLRECAPEAYKQFMSDLEASVARRVSEVILLPLSGSPVEFVAIDDAIAALSDGSLHLSDGEFVRYEVLLRFNNGDTIDAKFGAAHDAVQFLESFQ